MSSKRMFLDVDTSIVEKNLKFANDEEDQFNKLLTDANYAYKPVQPSPGICIKSKEVATETKVFVNICQTDAVPAPKDISSEELVSMIENDATQDFRVPMSIGDIKHLKDKHGNDVKVCDIAINPKLLKKIETIEEFKRTFIAIFFDALEGKQGLVCVDEKIIMKNRKSFGDLQMHRIQQRDVAEKMKGDLNEQSLLKEIGSENIKKKVVIEEINSQDTREPEYRLYRKKDNKNCLYGEFKLPDVLSANEVTLDVGEDRIVLESKTRGYLLDIFIPYVVKQKACKSTFDKKTKVLTLTAPLIGG